MESFPINLTDLVVVAILVLSGLFAFLRGFVREFLVLLSWVVAGVATYSGLPLLQPLMRQMISIEVVADIAGGLIIFLTVLIGLSIIAHFASRPIHSSELQPLNRSLGFIFGILRGALIVSALWLGIDYFVPSKDWPPTLRDARTMPLIQHGAGFLADFIPDEIRKESSSFGALRDDAEAAERAYRLLIAPPSKDAAADETPGYRDAERANMERLIESAQ
ncbi:MAG: CvpA family protein [Kiloniellales bacterium]|nr:CvpA family protein [Kiloniellales bacterium]